MLMYCFLLCCCETHGLMVSIHSGLMFQPIECVCRFTFSRLCVRATHSWWIQPPLMGDRKGRVRRKVTQTKANSFLFPPGHLNQQGSKVRVQTVEKWTEFIKQLLQSNGSRQTVCWSNHGWESGELSWISHFSSSSMMDFCRHVRLN